MPDIFHFALLGFLLLHCISCTELGFERLQAGFGTATVVTMASRIKGSVLESHSIAFFWFMYLSASLSASLLR